MRTGIIIVAGGSSLRMGGDLPKQFIPFNGKPILMHTLETFHRWNAEAYIVLVLPEDHQDYWRMLCAEIGCSVPHQTVNGGETRFHSVRNGLQALVCKQPDFRNESDGELIAKSCIAIHDGVRPFVSAEVIDRCFEAAQQDGAAIPVVSSVDSLREIDDYGSHPVDRSRYVCVQTPQVFWCSLLCDAYEMPYNPSFTDDASVAEAAGYKITTVAGNRENIKITTPFDLLVAQALFQPENKIG